MIIEINGNDNENGSVISEYLYDHEGNRLIKYIDNEITYYADNLISVVNNTGSFNTVYYYHDGTLIGRNETNTSNTYFYHPDHLGSTTLITNSSGDVVEETEYRPFGDVIFGGGDRYLFTGKELDRESNLEYFGSRYYNPELRIFVEPDSIIPNVYNPQSLNRYSYVLNNPYKYVDEEGDVAFLAPMLIGGAIGGIGGALISTGYQLATTGTVNLADVGRSAVFGAVTGGITGATFGAGSGVAVAIATSLVGPETTFGTLGAVSAVGGQAAINVLSGESASTNLNEAAYGGYLSGLVGGGASSLFSRFSSNKLFSIKEDISITTEKGQFDMTGHALDRLTKQGITKGDIIKTVEGTKGFEYSYKGEKFTGYYNQNTKLFVPASTKGRITTVGYRRQSYINNLKERR